MKFSSLMTKTMVLIGAALALSLSAQASPLDAEPSADRGRGAAQAGGGSGLRSLAAVTPSAQDFDGVLINGRDLLPGKRAYYRYMGSLTTPPRSEGVNWFFMVTPIQASLEQVLQFAAPIGSNNRPIQSDNGRLVLVPSSNN